MSEWNEFTGSVPNIHEIYTINMQSVCGRSYVIDRCTDTNNINRFFSRTKIPPPSCMRESGRGCCICFIITPFLFLYSHATNSLNYILYFVIRNTFVDEIYNRHLISGGFRSRFISYHYITFPMTSYQADCKSLTCCGCFANASAKKNWMEEYDDSKENQH